MPETIYLDPELAAKADALFRELGLDLATAVQLFLRQSLREHGLPFTPRLTSPACREQVRPDNVSASSTPCCKENSPAAQSECVHEQKEDRPYASSFPTEEPRQERMDDEVLQNVAQEEEKNQHEHADIPESNEAVLKAHDSPSPASEEGSELQQAFRNAGLMGRALRRVRSLNRLYAIGEPNPNVKGWREVYVSGDEPFALDFGSVRVELGFNGGGSIRMMDGRLPDEVLEADAVYPRDLSAVFSTVIGQPLTDVSTSRIQNNGQESEQINMHFANGCTLCFAPGGDWGALWLADAHGSVMFAPDAVWLHVLDDRALRNLR